MRCWTPSAGLWTVFARPAEWRRLQQNGMKADFSWDRSARAYVTVYKRAIRRSTNASSESRHGPGVTSPTRVRHRNRRGTHGFPDKIRRWVTGISTPRSRTAWCWWISGREWCAPCRRLAPTICQLAEDYAGQGHRGQGQHRRAPGHPSKFMVRGIPTLLLFKDGDLKETVVGPGGQDDLAKLIDKHL
ncbi:MAG: thioredoxin domain-containing protein [Vicinamibacterales bacterium]